MSAPRVVSLLPSATEIVCALGAAAALVGVSHECDYPDAVRKLPVLTRARVGASSTSREIDAAVRQVVAGALSIYSVDEAVLAGLSPELIITQDLCEVCAVSLDDVRRAVARLADRESIDIVTLSPTRLEHVFRDIERVALALGRREQGGRLLLELETRTRAIAERASRAKTRPRVATIEWLDPLMLGGTWMPELIELAGAVPVGVEPGAPAPTVTPDALGTLAPDVVVVKSCGFSVERTLAEAGLIEANIVRRCPAARVYVSDGNAYFNRPGPRLVESLEILAACAHPHDFPDLAAKHSGVMVRVDARASSPAAGSASLAE